MGEVPAGRHILPEFDVVSVNLVMDVPWGKCPRLKSLCDHFIRSQHASTQLNINFVTPPPNLGVPEPSYSHRMDVGLDDIYIGLNY